MKTIISSISSAFVLTLALGAAACGGKQQPAAQTTTHTETTTQDQNGQHSTTDMDTQHTVKQDGTTVDKTNETTKAVTPGSSSPGY
jgi:ABC-type glycerol-3-phosphate transport system substrate-binding protein